MTLVLACRFLKTVAVIADCRVSYDGRPEVDDNLQKLYQIDRKIVLGFSGPLCGAAQVMGRIRENSARCKRPRSASELVDDLARWIRWEYRKIENPMHRRNLSFVLASVEPGRSVRSTWRSQDGTPKPTPSWYAHVPDLRTLALRPSDRDPERLVTDRAGMCKVLGVGHEARNRIEAQIRDLYGFCFREPGPQAVVVAETVMALCMEMRIATVGGLFQVAVLGRDGIQWYSYGGGEATLRLEKGGYIQVNDATGRRVPLATIWDWMASGRLPGSTGVFEDPRLRAAIDDQKERGEPG